MPQRWYCRTVILIPILVEWLLYASYVIIDLGNNTIITINAGEAAMCTYAPNLPICPGCTYVDSI